MSTLKNALRGSELISGTDALPYLTDASSAVPEKPLAVVLAESPEDVATALAWANEHRVPVVARGAGTGVSGGAVSITDGLTISMERMANIISVRPADRLAVVQPGVVVDDLNRAAAAHGLMYAPDPASSATATIGGTIATNAGGLRCLRHGVTADNVLALQVALAGGRLLRTGAQSRKNVAGYDLTRLFVGSEGTLGVVTEATVRLRPAPSGDNVTFQVSFSSNADAGKAVAAVMASAVTPEILELVDRTTAKLIEAYTPSGLETKASATLIGQIISESALRQARELRNMFEQCGGFGFKSSADDSLLGARRNAFAALSAHGMGVAWLASDAAVPPSRLHELLDFIRNIQERHSRQISVVAHAGDGNIHAAVSADSTKPGDVAEAENIVELIAIHAVRLDGTVTGEHGTGSLKRHLLVHALDTVSYDVHRSIKQALDPLGILNPGRGI
ncbi:FAD-binding oxidoreductase [Arthrobacter sp. ZGTC412]|uniref:FAD-binding oxidoreductase n=1 Tax=Arthrobacter sp. ZGTC412 TaxID=2058900 RepID=UPI000CE42F59|nr:FAD-linked oxidase C-terminal domain-containing protein [Arthrobacter sp. ZGTC412]